MLFFMKLLFDFFPILVFFVTYKIWGLYYATAFTMVASLVQVAIFWVKYRKFEKMHVVTLLVALLFGSATLWFQDPLFIKWKTTVIYWLFAGFFLGSHFFGRKNFLQHMMDSKVQLSSTTWTRLNLSWALFFLGMGAVNLFVFYHYSEDTWVNFKLFGTMGLTLVFVILQAIYISKNMGKKYHGPVRTDIN